MESEPSPLVREPRSRHSHALKRLGGAVPKAFYPRRSGTKIEPNSVVSWSENTTKRRMGFNLFSKWLKRDEFDIETPEGWEKRMQELISVAACGSDYD